MANNDSSPEVCALWQSQPTQPMNLPPSELREKMRGFERRIRRRNIREYIAAVFVVGAFGYYAWIFTDLLMRFGSVLTMAAAVYVSYQIHRRASAKTAAPEMGIHSCIEFYRKELERQRDALRTVWVWYLLPFVPGMILFIAGMVHAVSTALPAVRPIPLGKIGLLAGYALGLVLMFLGIWKLNQRAATKLQVQIDRLIALSHEPDREGSPR